MIEDGGWPAPLEPPEAKRSRLGTILAAVLLAAVAAVGITLLVSGLESRSDADRTRGRAGELRRERRALIERTEAAEQVTDAPIGGAERVANSVASVVEATDAVIRESGDTNQLLSQAVRLANAGNRNAANRIYEGEAAASVRRLQEALARADAALAAAQQASTDLDAADAVTDTRRRDRVFLAAGAVVAFGLLAAGIAVAFLGSQESDDAERERAAARVRLTDVRAPLRRAEADRDAIRTAVQPFSDSAGTATEASARVVALERALVDRLARLRAAGSSADAGTYNRIVNELNTAAAELVDAFNGLELPLADFSRALEGLPTARCTAPAGRELRWTAYLDSGLQCARLRVPLDYAVPRGEQIELTLVRRPADDPAARIGPLVINPGGPGLSGIAFLREATLQMPAEILRRFDLVTFDPRGVGRSSPVDCGDNLDAVFLADLTAPARAERDAALKNAARLIRGCARRTGSLLRHVDTTSVARDLDRIRAALGVDRLNYLGYSYGTYLGAVYAHLFPGRLRAAVLDGAVHPERASRGVAIPDESAFADALAAALADCDADRSCPFAPGRDPSAAYDELMSAISRQPLDVGGRRFGRAAAELGVISGLYRGASGWPELMQALAAAAAGDGGPLSALTDSYTGRRNDGSYDTQMAAHYAVNCTDLEARLSPGEARDAVRDLSADPGRFEAVSLLLALPCTFWPVAPQPITGPLDAGGAATILVIGGEHDPATPIEGADALTEELGAATLLRWEGTGHTAFGRGSDCVDAAVVAYLVEGTVPRDGTTCPP